MNDQEIKNTETAPNVNSVGFSELLAPCSFCNGRGIVSFTCWMFDHEMEKECSFCWGSGKSSHLS